MKYIYLILLNKISLELLENHINIYIYTMLEYLNDCLFNFQSKTF